MYPNRSDYIIRNLKIENIDKKGENRVKILVLIKNNLSKNRKIDLWCVRIGEVHYEVNTSAIRWEEADVCRRNN